MNTLGLIICLIVSFAYVMMGMAGVAILALLAVASVLLGLYLAVTAFIAVVGCITSLLIVALERVFGP